MQLSNEISGVMISTQYEKPTLDAINRVAHFLLMLFKAELDLPDDAKCSLVAKPDQTGNNFSFALEVSHGAKVERRDVAIGVISERLGGNGCVFKVMFNGLMAVRIPSTPLSGMEEYLQALHQEKSFVQQVSSFIDSVSPELAVILKKLPQVRHQHTLHEQLSEDDFEQLLRSNQRLESYFWVGETNVFFTDLSSREPLEDHLADIHGIEKSIRREQSQILNALWDQGEVESLYDDNVSAAAYRINESFLRLKNSLDRTIRYRKGLAAVSDYTKRNWFTEWLDTETLAVGGNQYPDSFIEDLNQLFARHFEKNQTVVKDFSAAVKAFTRGKNFEQKKRHIEGVINNILDLVSNLGKARLAVRDLKPENIYLSRQVAGTRFSLSASGTYSLGIIDVEPAVKLDPSNGDNEKQPPLTGSSGYATPSHFMSTPLLQRVLGDPAIIFRMQDLFAALGLIFQAATGERLFVDTGELTPAIAHTLLETSPADRAQLESFHHNSAAFWDCVENEFQSRLLQSKRPLSQLRISIPDRLAQEMRRHIFENSTIVEEWLKTSIARQKFFKAANLKVSLLNASAEKIFRTVEKWKDANFRADIPPVVREYIIKWLNQIGCMKQRQHLLSLSAKKLADFPCRISALALLILIFDIVYRHMYREKWTKYEHPLYKIAFAKE